MPKIGLDDGYQRVRNFVELEFVDDYVDVPLADIPGLTSRDISNELSDLLTDYNAIMSMFDVTRSCDAAAYGSITYPNRIAAAVRDFPKARWDALVLICEHDSYLSPGIGALGVIVKWAMEEMLPDGEEKVRLCEVECSRIKEA